MATRGTLRDRITRRTSLRGNLVANYIGRIWEAAMSVAFVPLYIAYLGPEAYGVVGLVAVIQSFMLILDLGMTPTLTREAARFDAGDRPAASFADLLRSIECLVLATGAAIVAGVVIAAPVIAGGWIRPQALPPAAIAQALTIAGVLIALRFFESIYRGALQGLRRQLLCNLIGAGFATLRGIGAVAVVAAFEAGLGGFFAWQVLASIGAVMAMRAGVRQALPEAARDGRFSLDAMTGVARFSAGMIAISVLSLAATQADKLILPRIVPLADFGYYVFALNVAIALELVVTPMMAAVYPQLVADISRGETGTLIGTFHRWAAVVAVLTAAAAAWLFAFGPLLVLTWSGDAALAAQSGPLLSVIAIGTFLHAQCALPYHVQLGHGRTGIAIAINIAALAITVPSLALLVPRFGTLAAAWTWVAVASLYFVAVVGFMFAGALGRERTRFLLADVGAPTAAAFLAAVAMRWLLIEPPTTLAGRLAILSLAGMASLAAAAGAAWAFRRWQRPAHYPPIDNPAPRC